MDVLSEIIECSVCLERMDTKSRVLPCQHTFCSDCLHKIAIQNKNELKCPECRYICTIPVRDLPANILLIRLLEGLKAAGKNISSKRELLKDAGRPCAEAMYSYEPQEPGDLKFRRGDLIYLKKRLDENWYVGELNGKSGYMPATYVKVICPFPSSPQGKPPAVIPSTSHVSVNQSETNVSPQSAKVTVRALYDFEMKDEEKEDCLKFRKDEVIQLIRRVDQNWAEGKLHGAIGIFPLNYVRVSETARALLDAPQSRSSSGVNRGSNSVRTRNISGPAVFSSPTSCSVPTDQPDTSQRLSDPAGRHLSASGASATAEPNAYIAVPGAVSHKQSQNASFSAPNDSSVLHSARPPSVIESERSQQRSRLSDGVKVDNETSPAIKRISNHDIYQAMYNYKPQKEDELPLTRGSYYQVSDRCKDGWYRGKCLRTGSSGVFPGNYVQLIPPEGEGAVGEALLTMRRGRLEPPTEKQAHADKPNTTSQSGSPNTAKVVKSSGKPLDGSSRYWGMDVAECRTPSPKMRKEGRRSLSTGNRDRRRSSSLSRLENQLVTREQSSQPIRHRSGKSSESNGKPHKMTRMRYVCVMAYPSQGELELDLKVGDVVVVLKKKSQGWYKGTNETTGKTGVFPACFVQSFTSSSSNESRSS